MQWERGSSYIVLRFPWGGSRGAREGILLVGMFGKFRWGRRCGLETGRMCVFSFVSLLLVCGG